MSWCGFGQRDNRPLLYPAIGGGSCAVRAELVCSNEMAESSVICGRAQVKGGEGG
nr:MAG TPA: hypothetical protein [Caudoviricetes sp.]DAN65942.1 MAG TPA: hypothetical protein [Caudoviricetes sp.]